LAINCCSSNIKLKVVSKWYYLSEAYIIRDGDIHFKARTEIEAVWKICGPKDNKVRD
jgi:hypothetical protein